ncbi:MAG: RsmD family RNA methyltransferase [Planctomycetes bacterium]|nr:RsmD family RNA methyltransferase [Planctomycetota bacterium]
MPRRQPKSETGDSTAIRISSGEFRGRKIDCPQTGGVRPMLSRTRMALFNLVRDRLKGATVWDCFAGSGLLGIEAVSQGAAFCVFTERDPAHARVVQANLDSLGLRDRSNVIRGSIFDLVKPGVPRLPHTPAGLVLLDPPHAMIREDDGPFWPWLRGLPESPLKGDDTLIAIGHPAEMDFPVDLGGLSVVETRVYGTVAFTLLS